MVKLSDSRSSFLAGSLLIILRRLTAYGIDALSFYLRNDRRFSLTDIRVYSFDGATKRFARFTPLIGSLLIMAFPKPHGFSWVI
jgi:hypothetical protein